MYEEFGRAFAGGGIVIRNEARIVEVSLHKAEIFLFFVILTPMNRDPLLMHARARSARSFRNSEAFVCSRLLPERARQFLPSFSGVRMRSCCPWLTSQMHRRV